MWHGFPSGDLEEVFYCSAEVTVNWDLNKAFLSPFIVAVRRMDGGIFCASSFSAAVNVTKVICTNVTKVICTNVTKVSCSNFIDLGSDHLLIRKTPAPHSQTEMISCSFPPLKNTPFSTDFWSENDLFLWKNTDFSW